MSRALYRYGRFDLQSVPKPKRGQALELQIRQWTPFAKTASYVLWDKDHAQVWAWDAERAEFAIRACKMKPDRIKIIPETLLHKRREHGVFLAACLEGVEGQVWSGHSLIGSRWWPELPGSGEWLNLQRDAGILPEKQSHVVPAALPVYLEDKPWGRSVVLEGSARDGGKAEAWVVPLAALCLFAGSMWYGAQWIKLQAATQDRNAELEALNQQAGPIIEARGKALESLGRIKQLQALDPYPNQASLMAKLAESLPQDGTYLKEWDFANGKLKVSIVSPAKLVNSDYIKRFQSLEIFRNVQTVPTNDLSSLVLGMEVVPQAEIKFAENSEAARKEGAAAAVR